jgi:ADP-heptose:LPS heptosyltransferase
VSTRQLHQDRGNARLKLLDRYAGIPVVSAAGAWRSMRGRRPVPERWDRIGLLKTAGIGDTVLLSAIVADVRAQRPDAHIVLFVTANNAGFAALLDGVDELVILPVRNVPKALRMVRERDCDVFVDFGAWPRLDALLAAGSGARSAVGRQTSGQHRHGGYDVVVAHRRDHELDNYRRLVAEVGIRSTSEPSINRGAGAPRPLASEYAVLHLWPGGSNFDERSWARTRWIELASVLSGQGLDIVLTGGPEDVDATAAVMDACVASGVRARSIAGLEPAETVTWLRHAAGVVSVNTGIMHLAAAVDAPVVALNGPTSSRRWGPLGAHARCVVSPVVPDGYLDLGFERDERYSDCMQAITVASVLAAWADLMAELAA